MPIQVITSIISAISILAGSAMGAWFSWIINNKMHKRKMMEEYDLIKDNRKYEEHFKIKEVCANANVIRLDICTAIYQSIRILKLKEDIKNQYIYMIPINKNYSCSVASLSDKYTLKELSYLYQLYGIIENVNLDICNLSSNDKNNVEKVLAGFEAILKKVYGNNVQKIFEYNIDTINYEELYRNEYIKEGYKNLLDRLNYLCAEENLLKEKISIESSISDYNYDKINKKED